MVNITLGWLNIVLIFLIGLIYPIKKVYLRNKNKKLLWIYKKIRVVHPFVGVIIIIVGIIHGYMSLGILRLHTGSFIIYVVIIMGMLALLGPYVGFLKKRWRSIHRNMAVILWIFIGIHLFFRSLI